MAVQPSTARLGGTDSQAFTADTKPVTWTISPSIGSLAKLSDSCVYTGPPKFRVWFSRQIVLSATGADGQSAGSAIITLDPAPSWVFALSGLYIALFLAMAISVIALWPPAPAVPWIDVTPPTVTIPPGLTQQFDASIWHQRDQSVTWSATDGVITSTGLFTAPDASTGSGSRIVVTATSNVDKNLTRSALVLLNQTGLEVQPASVSLGPGESKVFQVAQIANGASPAASSSGTKSPLKWVASESCLKLPSGSNGPSVTVQASNPLSCPDRVILTVRDEGNANRQASAMVYLSRNRTPLAVALSQDELTQDKGLLVLVTLIGAMGALLGASRSLASYVGNDAFVPRWTLFYLFRPTFGAGLALLVFFGYRIGAISGVKGAAPANPFAAAFIAGLVGLFADTVLQKLKDVFTALFPTTPAQDQRKDTIAEPAAITPAIESVTSSAAQKRMTVKGKNFVAGAKVMLNGTERPTASTAPGELSVVLDPADAGDMKVVVIDPDKQRSAEFQTRIGS